MTTSSKTSKKVSSLTVPKSAAEMSSSLTFGFMAVFDQCVLVGAVSLNGAIIEVTLRNQFHRNITKEPLASCKAVT